MQPQLLSVKSSRLSGNCDCVPDSQDRKANFITNWRQPGARLLMGEVDDLYEATDTRISMTTDGEGAGEE